MTVRATVRYRSQFERMLSDSIFKQPNRAASTAPSRVRDDRDTPLSVG
jgi:hypothetical protein